MSGNSRVLLVLLSLRRLLGAAGVVIALVCIPLAVYGLVVLAQRRLAADPLEAATFAFSSACAAVGALLAWWGFRSRPPAAPNEADAERSVLSLAGPDGTISAAEVVLKTSFSAAEVRAAADRLCATGLIAEVASAEGGGVYRVLDLPRGTRASPPVPAPGPASAPAVARIDALVIRHGLTPAEANILGLLATGLTNDQIGETLFVSSATVRTHVYNLFRKLGVRSRVQATLLVVGEPAALEAPRTTG